MAVIQFKRVFDFYPDGFDYDIAIDKIIQDANLAEGEPIVCSYRHKNACKYLFAIRTNTGLQTFPMFSSISEIQEFIKINANAYNILDDISDASDIEASSDSDGKLVLKVKDDFKNI